MPVPQRPVFNATAVRGRGEVQVHEVVHPRESPPPSERRYSPEALAEWARQTLIEFFENPSQRAAALQRLDALLVGVSLTSLDGARELVMASFPRLGEPLPPAK